LLHYAFNGSRDFDMEHYAKKTFSTVHSIGFMMLTKTRNSVTADIDAGIAHCLRA
jgi:hypothetical protein